MTDRRTGNSWLGNAAAPRWDVIDGGRFRWRVVREEKGEGYNFERDLTGWFPGDGLWLWG